jgi:hypothetical protein
VLSFDGECYRFIFAQVTSSPYSFEQVEAEIASECLFDDLAVSFAGACCSDLHRTEYFFVDREGRTRLCHEVILAS